MTKMTMAALLGCSLSAAALRPAGALDAAGALLCQPSQTQLAACEGKAAGDACAFTAADGTTGPAGTCRATIDGASVACAPAPPPPPQPAIDACAARAAGDACMFSGRGGESLQGTCGNGPAAAGPLACGPARRGPPDLTAACTGKVAGDACARSSPRGSAAGTCMAPADGSAAVCAVACDALAGKHGHRGPHGPH